MALPKPLDPLPAVKFGQQFIQPAVCSQGLMGSVAENPTGLTAVDPCLEHPIHQTQIELAIDENTRAVAIRHLVPLDTQGDTAPRPVNAKYNDCINLSRVAA